ncbi:MAG: hypothetical protein RRB13_03330 [bacterium]|nr:hypothetical protein [bacterium]
MTLYQEPEVRAVGIDQIANLFIEIEGEEEQFILDHSSGHLKDSPEGKMLLSFLEDEKSKAQSCRILLKGHVESRPIVLKEWDFQALRTLNYMDHVPGAWEKQIGAKALLQGALAFESKLNESLENLASEMGHPADLTQLINLNKKTMAKLKEFLG